ncbi:MAG: hypothetical protein ABR98_07620 [Cryomorphaceae bacterium BACL7 MAG-120910-bin2]|jgi:alkane 1-monooxygenase|nr:MAG: hypothetical protein ABR98_07620 [Cryomorphaceae bacterium BACL7 MAG-120910-bin2]KRO68657.1 MAG: hypothetical protein ABR88_07760 [Cryomorphaceae bacterium BACL7 MAG-120322-bin74]KRO83202.1 MAG: hypothetical protein ABR87_03200 [Cryomorphaceae bacterium BACL7 MAG-121220-bin83]
MIAQILYPLRYLMAFTLTAAVWFSLNQQGILSYSALLYGFGMVPLLEVVLVPVARNMPPDTAERAAKNPWFDALLWLALPAQIWMLWMFILVVPKDVGQGDFLSLLGHVTSYGVSAGSLGINVAHELGHRPQRAHQTVAKCLLLLSLYPQFFIDHNRGHHKLVGTPEDPTSARRNETVYAFWIRSVFGVWRSAWHIDAPMMRRFLVWEVALLLALAWVEPAALFPFVAASAVGFLLLETVNYIEHYGLSRKQVTALRYEDTAPTHSWNSNHPMGRFMLFELTRHSDHHAAPHKVYPTLSHHEEAPQMPTGYPAMMLLSLVPPLWFKVMNKRIPNN